VCSAYKVYAEILRNRLDTEAQKNGLIPESRGFQKREIYSGQYICIEPFHVEGQKAWRRERQGISILCGFKGGR